MSKGFWNKKLSFQQKQFIHGSFAGWHAAAKFVFAGICCKFFSSGCPCEDCCKWTACSYRKLQDYEAFLELHFRKVDRILQEVNDRTVFARRLRDNGNLAETPKFFLQRKGVPLIYSLIQEV